MARYFVRLPEYRSIEMCYHDCVPRKLKPGHVIVHNHIAHTKDMPSGVQGFRFWTQKLTDGVVPCECGWRGVLHYHVKGTGHKSFTRKQLEARLGHPLWY
jgi:hypothetical protein